ncbi:MAG: hypothetical protein ABJC26_11580 [Gemmatimonadaceae bacterium]
MMIKTLPAMSIVCIAAMFSSTPIAEAQTQANKQTTLKPPAKAATKSPSKSLPADSVLLAIIKRGRAINDYDFAAWHGSDALATTKVNPNQITHYIAKKTATGWLVGFGHLNATRDAFLLMAEAASGGDARFLISADGRTIISRRQLHNTIIDFNPTKIAAVNGGQVVVSMHSAVLDDLPEDTDVFHVLNRFPHVPEMIVTKSFVFRVEMDGTVKCLGRSEDVIKK